MAIIRSLVTQLSDNYLTFFVSVVSGSLTDGSLISLFTVVLGVLGKING